MKTYRLTKAQYQDDLTGKGAELSGGRWNSKGTPIIYMASSIALSTAEIVVHVPLGIIPKNYVCTTFEVPNEMEILNLSPEALPNDWRSIPHSNSTQIIGDQFIKNAEGLILKVPSAVVPGDFNYLINPFHPDVIKLEILQKTPYNFDDRLFIR